MQCTVQAQLHEVPGGGTDHPAVQHLLRSIHNLCNTRCMTVSTIGPGGPHIPQWDMYDRMAKSLKDAHISIAEAATYFGVHRNTVSGWLHERINPDTRTLRLWAVMTNVPYEWLKAGIDPTQGPGGGSPFDHPEADREKKNGNEDYQFLGSAA